MVSVRETRPVLGSCHSSTLPVSVSARNHFPQSQPHSKSAFSTVNESPSAVPGILLIARLFVSRAGGHQSPQSPTYEQAGERSMEFFLLLFLTSGPKGARARHRAVVRYAFVDASVASVPWSKGHSGRLGASTLFRRHARYRLDLGVARVRAGFSRRANYLPPGQGCHRPSGKQRHGTMPGKETAI